jgi:hypothetical protein
MGSAGEPAIVTLDIFRIGAVINYKGLCPLFCFILVVLGIELKASYWQELSLPLGQRPLPVCFPDGVFLAMPGLASNSNLPVSTSQIAGATDVLHFVPPYGPFLEQQETSLAAK